MNTKKLTPPNRVLIIGGPGEFPDDYESNKAAEAIIKKGLAPCFIPEDNSGIQKAFEAMSEEGICRTYSKDEVADIHKQNIEMIKNQGYYALCLIEGWRNYESFNSPLVHQKELECAVETGLLVFEVVLEVVLGKNHVPNIPAYVLKKVPYETNANISYKFT